jgi:UDP-N-acetylmuramoyl-tripeptide--D-alanyl-D-alanine ligase
MAGALGSGRGFAAHNFDLNGLSARLGGTLIDSRGKPLSSTEKVLGINTDSRSAALGEVFLALKGERFDGHNFVAQAFKQGAVACVADHRDTSWSPEIKIILVKDTLAALGSLAAAVRNEVDPLVLAVTGSVGKTTVKTMLYSIFNRSDRKVIATQGNFNNHVGLPLTLLNLCPDVNTAVLELGANHKGEIASLTAICRPDVGLVTMAGSSHLEFFGSLQEVAQAKGELYRGLSAEAVAVVNASDPLMVEQAKAFGGNKLFFGPKGSEAQVYFEDRSDIGLSGQRLKLSGPGRKTPLNLKLQLFGLHNALNAAAAAAAALAAGADWIDIASGLEQAAPVPGRLRPLKTDDGLFIIDDSYNANPNSMEAALGYLGGVDNAVKGAILGDMLELGPSAEKFHHQVGLWAAKAGLDYLALVGGLMALAKKEAVEGGLSPEKIVCFSDPQQAASWAAETFPKDSVILIKGSHSVGLEKAVTFLVSEENRKADKRANAL